MTEKASGCEVELSRNRFINQEAFVSHANAALTPRARLRLAQFVVEEGWTYAAAAKMFMVSPRTAKKWADRFRAAFLGGHAPLFERCVTAILDLGEPSSPAQVQPSWKKIFRVRIRRPLGTTAAR